MTGEIGDIQRQCSSKDKWAKPLQWLTIKCHEMDSRVTAGSLHIPFHKIVTILFVLWLCFVTDFQSGATVLWMAKSYA